MDTKWAIKGNGDQQTQRHREEKAWRVHRKSQKSRTPRKGAEGSNLERETGCRLWGGPRSD